MKKGNKMKKLILVFFIIFGFLYADCKLVGTVQGLRYSNVLKQWFSQDVDIWACYYPNDEYKNIFVINIPNITKSRAFLTSSNLDDLINSLKKAIKWANKAKTKKVPTFSKELFNYDLYGKLTVEFFTANKGQQDDVILRTVDVDNEFEKGEAYLNCFTKVPKLIKLLKKVKPTWNELEKANKIKNEFN